MRDGIEKPDSFMESGLGVLAELLAEQLGQPQSGVHLHGWRLLDRERGEGVEEGPSGAASEVLRVGALPVSENLGQARGGQHARLDRADHDIVGPLVG